MGALEHGTGARRKELGSMKIVINTCFGGFGLSKEAVTRMADRGCPEAIQHLANVKMWNADEGGTLWHDLSIIPRDDRDLVDAVKHLGVQADGNYARLRIVEIPDDVKFYIADYDGVEHIAEVHRTWN